MNFFLSVITALFLPFYIVGQDNGQETTPDCERYDKMIQYVLKDADFNSYFQRSDIKVSDEVFYKTISDWTIPLYVANKLGVSVKEIYKRDSAEVRSIFKEDEPRNCNFVFRVNCLTARNDSTKARISVSFMRFDEKILSVDCVRGLLNEQKKMGLSYLFYFDDNNNILKVYNRKWQSKY